jgi:hypothetical protein
MHFRDFAIPASSKGEIFGAGQALGRVPYLKTTYTAFEQTVVFRHRAVRLRSADQFRMVGHRESRVFKKIVSVTERDTGLPAAFGRFWEVGG